MGSTQPTPAEPRLARALLIVVTPRRERGFVVGDITEEFSRMLARGVSRERARRWYWQQVLGSVVPGLRRVRARSQSARRTHHGGLGANLRLDMRYAIRSLRRKPFFAALAVSTLAAGIAVNVAMFSIVNGVLLTPLLYEQPDRVVGLFERRPMQAGASNVSYPDFHDISERSRTLAGVAATQEWQPTAMLRGEPLRLFGVSVSGNYFEILGVEPHAGRFFLPEEDELGHQPVIVLSHGFWQENFGGDADIIGGALTLSGIAYTVVGVAPPDLEVLRGDIEVWRARPAFFSVTQQFRTGHNMQPVARMAPGVTLADVNAELHGLSEQLEAENPNHVGHRVTAVRVMDLLVGSVRPAMIVLLAAVAVVLTIACANVANLMLIRATEREREVAVRTALGASRGRLVGQLLLESLVLASAGAVLGTGLAYLGTQTFVRLGDAQLPRAALVSIDGGVLTFALAITVFTALLFGLAPAIQGTSTQLVESLKEGSRGTTEGGRRRSLRRTLVVAEVALSVVLLVGAALLVKTFRNLQSVDTGFEPANVLTMRLYPPITSYPEHGAVTRFYERVIERLSGLPGVTSAAAVSFLPMSGDYDGEGITRDDLPLPKAGEGLGAEARAITTDYFATLGITLLRGRGFSAADDSAASAVAIVNASLAIQLFPDGRSLGQHVTMARISREIVGVVNDVRQFGVQGDVEPTLYAPHPQPFVPWIRRNMSLAIRAAGDPSTMANAVRATVQQVGGTVAITDVQPLEHLVAADIANPRFRATLLTLFSLLALFLAAVGIAGTMGYSVAQRKGEIGIRMALGAVRKDALALVLRDGMKLVVLGIGIGLAVALALNRFLQALLFEVAPHDPMILIAVPLVLATVALGALLVPAFRASGVDPLEALRVE